MRAVLSVASTLCWLVIVSNVGLTVDSLNLRRSSSTRTRTQPLMPSMPLLFTTEGLGRGRILSSRSNYSLFYYMQLFITVYLHCQFDYREDEITQVLREKSNVHVSLGAP